MIKAWTDGAEAGLFDRHGERGSTFVYLPGAAPARAVSVTMPVRLESWSVPFGLPPIFEMNLPEGALRERLRLAFAKATGRFDEFDLLAIVGRSQVGRVRFTGDQEGLHEDVPFQSVDEILERRRDGDLFNEDMVKLFMLIALNCALRNGDAHLKNFGVVYDDVQGGSRLAPVYDLVTTTVYLPKDSMALTLNETTRWPSAKELKRLGETRLGRTPAKVRQILQKIDVAMAQTMIEVRSYIHQHPGFAEIGARMLQEWEKGATLSLRV
jgi:HipA-like protein